MEYTVRIPGEPFGKQRPRHTKYCTYTPQPTKDHERQIAECYKAKYKNTKPIEGYVEIDITAYFGIPKSTSKAKRRLMIDGTLKPAKKPDWDNVGKLVSDALNGIAYADDKQIVSAHITKLYSEEPYTDIIVRAINEES